MPAKSVTAIVCTYPLGLGLILGALAGGLAVPAPALAQSAQSRIDQPTPGTMPTAPDRDQSGRGSGSGQVSPPRAIQSSTEVMRPQGAAQGQGAPSRANPMQHLPENMR
ncbi:MULTISPECIES: hypothetical protein [Methylobacterium]|uniref:Uncharacterized protein n=1 Tax=Methylobacterium longum TaxID=767694 RepID=A0ABT8AK30_9HYPH|nr:MULTISPECIES: hypothetical protein [Methylobacterium]MCJ2102845.1 hypothetical protein [Methylobacterium sp. E-046]MDN3570204.1 hypothetical protein [Methylobacterium longum]GJE13418.1 hypothetical protein FOHLNKBM_4481 [Methylobacterium longum]